MEVSLPYIVQDQVVEASKGVPAIESFVYDAADDTMLDGPVSQRVALLDFDEATGAVRNGVRFEPPAGRRKRGRYDVPRVRSNRDFQNVSVFATVLKTMREFERPDVLGRRLRWAFDGPQLLVVPRAGDWANAFYERETRSLQFFHFYSEKHKRVIFTSQSHDIVAHETGHAILDGILPDLYDATSPESLALHEAVADLTALTMSLESGTLRKRVLDDTGGRISGLTALSSVAEEFGHALDSAKPYLRSLWNSTRMDSRGLDPASPHDLSEVLSGALFRVLDTTHEKFKRNEAQLALIDEVVSDPEDASFQGSGKALRIASWILRRLMFRALDYLPPGEVSFADYGRAIWAADEAANPEHPEYRKALESQFRRRRIIGKTQTLSRGIRPRPVWRPKVDMAALLESDWAAYDFANRERARLGIPPDVPFRVLPRLAVQKETYRGDPEPHCFRELLFKVVWEHAEQDDVGFDLPSNRMVRAGLTLVLDRDNGRVRALLHSDTGAAQRRARSRFLGHLFSAGLLDPRGGTSGEPGSVDVEIARDVLRVRGSARSLHIAHGGSFA